MSLGMRSISDVRSSCTRCRISFHLLRIGYQEYALIMLQGHHFTDDTLDLQAIVKYK